MKGPLIGQGRTAEVFAWGEDQILKLYRLEFPVQAVELEARVGRAVCEAGIAAPAVEGQVEVEGRPGIIYRRVRGASMLDVLSRQPWLVLRFARQFAELHAKMHAATQQELPSQREKLKRDIERAPQLSAPMKEKALQKLGQLPSGNITCHGDFHPGNILMSKDGPVIIDWMTASQGNPLADVARTSYLLSRGTVPPGTNWIEKLLIQTLRRLFHFVYLRRYRKLRPFSEEELEQWRLIIAAARLSEEIAKEEAQLMAIIQKNF